MKKTDFQIGFNASLGFYISLKDEYEIDIYLQKDLKLHSQIYSYGNTHEGYHKTRDLAEMCLHEFILKQNIEENKMSYNSEIMKLVGRIELEMLYSLKSDLQKERNKGTKEVDISEFLLLLQDNIDERESK